MSHFLQTVPSRRDHKIAAPLAAVLALLVLLLSFASVSPQLHGVLHAHSEGTQHDAHGHCTHSSEHPTPQSEHSDDHSCAVTLFSDGLTLSMPSVLPQRSQHTLAQFSLLSQSVWQLFDRASQSARAPPTRKLV